MKRALLLWSLPLLGLAGLAFARDAFVGTNDLPIVSADGLLDPQTGEFDPFMAEPLGTLPYNTKVNVVQEGPGWTYVRVRADGKEGFVPASSLRAEAGPAISGRGGAVSADDTSAAARGFTPGLEADRRQANPNLDAAYASLDQMEVLAAAITREQLRYFRDAGGLGAPAAR